MGLNMNELAKKVSELDVGKKELSIAQIKEVMRILAVIFYQDRETHFNFSAYAMKIGMIEGRENV